MTKKYLPLLFLLALVFHSCKKDEKFLWRNTGIWEIQSMQVDYLNASGSTDSTVTDCQGFMMFYNTPTDPPVQYLCTYGITVKGVEKHGAYFWTTTHKTITLDDANYGEQRAYDISDRGWNKMTLDYSGPMNNMYYNSFSGNIKEHIVLKRVKD